MKQKLIKYGSIISAIVVLCSCLIIPANAQVNEALTPNMTLVWNDSPTRPFTGTSDYATYYEFGFFDARGEYCIGMEINYRSSDGFNIRYVYDNNNAGGSREVYNDGSGRDPDAYWAPYAKYITLISLPSDPSFIAYLQANMSISQGMSYAEGYKYGYELGLNQGYNQGYDDGFDDGNTAGTSASFGKNLLGDTLAVPINALNGFVLFTAPNGTNVTLGGVVGAVIGLSLFIMFLKIFAGG